MDRLKLLQVDSVLRQWAKTAAEAGSGQAEPAAEPATAPAAEPPALDDRAREYIRGTLREWNKVPRYGQDGLDLGDYSGVHRRLMRDPQLVERYRTQLGPDATPQQIGEAAVRDYIPTLVNPQTVEQAGRNRAQLLRLTQSPIYGQEASETLQQFPQSVQKQWSSMTPAEQEQYRRATTEDFYPSGVADVLRAAGQDPYEGLRGGVLESAEELAGAELETLQQGVEHLVENPDTTGWGDWLSTNWQTLAVPAGAIAFLFGGNVGKVLGTMAMAAGGYNLYERYNRLTNPENQYHEPVVQVIREAAKDKFQKPEEAIQRVVEARGNPELAPVLQSSLKDFTFLAGHGFMEQIQERINRQAQQLPQQFTDQLLPPAGAGQAQPEPNWWDRISPYWRSVDQFMVPGGKG